MKKKFESHQKKFQTRLLEKQLESVASGTVKPLIHLHLTCRPGVRYTGELGVDVTTSFPTHSCKHDEIDSLRIINM